VRFPAAVAVAGIAAAITACAGPNEDIVDDPFDIAEAVTAPEITSVADIGGGDVPLSGPLGMEASDGVAAIGEALWIRGRGFGRQPTVEVAGRPAAVLGRTRDGGIVVRVPAGAPPGPQAVAVKNDVGRSASPITVRRYVAVLAPGAGQIAWAALGSEGPTPIATTPVPGARWLALSGDGRAAFVAGGRRSSIDVIDLPAPHSPSVTYRMDLGPAPVLALAAAARAPVAAVVRATDVVVLDTSSPLRPARSQPRALPQEVRDGRIAAADISPDGKLLAIAIEARNQVLILDLEPPGRAPVVGRVAIVPEVRESVLVDLAFSPGGDTLWVVSGDTPRSEPVGPQPTQVHAIRVGALSHLTVARTVRVEGASNPARVGVGRAEPLVSGAAIRLPPERHPVFFAATDRQGAAVFRVGAEDSADVALTAAGRFGRPDVSFDGRWLLAPAAGSDGSISVLTTAIDGRPAPAGAAKPIAAIAYAAEEMPAAVRPVPDLRVQP
jgi:hypothetical protein